MPPLVGSEPILLSFDITVSSSVEISPSSMLGTAQVAPALPQEAATVAGLLQTA